MILIVHLFCWYENDSNCASFIYWYENDSNCASLSTDMKMIRIVHLFYWYENYSKCASLYTDTKMIQIVHLFHWYENDSKCASFLLMRNDSKCASLSADAKLALPCGCIEYMANFDETTNTCGIQ